MEQEVEEVVMESTAQYWKPVWGALERYWKPTCQKREGAGPMSGAPHLAQAQSNRRPRGRKKDSPDAERLVKRLVSQELTLSFVPDTEQRLWPKMPKLQSIRRHGSGMPRMEPAIRASGMTPAQATRPKLMTHLLRTGSTYGPIIRCPMD